jgi:hypothetical protein
MRYEDRLRSQIIPLEKVIQQQKVIKKNRLYLREEKEILKAMNSEL